ncbi:MAG: tRNA uridine-5-carboxymethylaminomethyl(34) synthesis GTPase MnmE [Deltaproteobacteria bacterium]|nr:tRNA uridine-5-carboxymethylaminomethyl(34) synthesis GTPase MnmE [Deltaproteobacteria bacterium]
MVIQSEPTIAAIATPPGLGGIGIIRISGPSALTILRKIFIPKKQTTEFTSHHLFYGWIKSPDTGQLLDEVLAVYMRAPHTYTRDDVVEIQAHGSFTALQQILTLTQDAGARLAEPGEFTKNAFLNGRLDLTQAEAVIELLQAKTAKGVRAAVNQLQGGLHSEIQEIIAMLLQIKALIEVAIDFPDDEIELLDADKLHSEMRQVVDTLQNLISAADHGRILREGLVAVIIGRPNVGKSSLLNTLLRVDRAIVTPVPGTTRDTIEEHLDIKGLPVKIIDTAGIREAAGEEIENIGIMRSRAKLAEADLVILLLDSSMPLQKEDYRLVTDTKDKPRVLAANKEDIGRPDFVNECKEAFPDQKINMISAKNNTGIKPLKEAIFTKATGQKSTGWAPEHAALPNIRHRAALVKARNAGQDFITNLSGGVSPDLLAIDMQTILDNLGDIVGYTTTEDVLDKIFGQFCLGK